jgi:hypothetical protein
LVGWLVGWLESRFYFVDIFCIGLSLASESKANIGEYQEEAIVLPFSDGSQMTVFACLFACIREIW